MDKAIEKGLKMYKKVGYKGLKKVLGDRADLKEIRSFYLKRHKDIATHTAYGENNYRLHFMSHIITITALYETLLQYGFTKDEACKLLRKLQEPLGKVAGGIYKLLDALPFGYKMIRWSLMKDMTGELGRNFQAEFPQDDEKGFSYIVHKCIYVDTFNAWGYPELIRVCCDNDINCFNGLHRRVKWTRKCNVGEQKGIHCYDVFEKIK